MARCVLALALVLFCLCPASAERVAEPMVMAFGPPYPPFDMPPPPGRPEAVDSGMFVDFLREFEARHPQFATRRIRLPRPRLEEWLAAGKVDALALTSDVFMPRERRWDSLYSLAVWHCAEVVISRRDAGLHYLLPEDLRGRTVGVLQGASYPPLAGAVARGEVDLSPVRTEEQLVGLLASGRLKAIVGNRHSTVHAMRRQGIDPAGFVFAEAPLMEFDLMVQVRKERGDYLRALNEFILLSRANGFLRRLEETYLVPGR